MSRTVRSCVNSVKDLKRVVEKYEQFENNDATRSCWQTNTRVSRRYLAYRWAQFVIHAFYAFMSILEIGRKYHEKFLQLQFVKSTKYYAKWFLYLTHWGLLLNAAQAFLSLWIVNRAYQAQERLLPNDPIGSNAVPPALIQIYLRMFVVATNLSAYITLGYWFWVYDPSDSLVDWLTLSEHGFGTVLLVVDLFVVGVPYKVLYGIYTMILACVYLTFTYVHHLSGALDRFQEKRYLYEKNDWYRPTVVFIYFLLTLLIMFSFNLTLWVLYLLRRHLNVKLRRSSRRRDSTGTTV